MAEKVDDIKEERLIRILPSGRQASSVISNNIFLEFNQGRFEVLQCYKTGKKLNPKEIRQIQ